MRIEQLALTNYRLFDNFVIDFSDGLTVIAGDNGAGKTTVIEGVAVAISAFLTKFAGVSSMSIKSSDARLASYALGSSDDVQAQFPVKVSAAGFVGEEHLEWSRSLNAAGGKTTYGEANSVIAISAQMQERLQRGDRELLLPLIAYYGTGRLWDMHREKRDGGIVDSTRTNGYIDCLSGTANIKLMRNWFRDQTVKKYQRQEQNLGPVPELEAVLRALEMCYANVTGFHDVKVLYNLNTNDLDVYYTEGQERMRIAMSQLSDGYKGTISLIADIAYRMATLNPQLLDRVLEETEGIVLIDEVDLHLHPQWQKRVLKDLTTIFPKVQFIVSTHAPEVINSVRSENLVMLKGRRAVSASSEVYGKDVASVLKEVMEVDERPQAVVELFNNFYRCLVEHKYNDAEQYLDLLDKLRDYSDPEVARCRVKLRLAQIGGNVK